MMAAMRKGSQRPDLSVVLACYNEELVFNKSVAEIVKVLNASGLAYELIFVDDGSYDRTPELIRKYLKKHGEAIFHSVNQGRGQTVVDGFKIAKGCVVGYIDIDLEVSPIYIPQCVNLILKNKADLVIGRRIYRTNLRSLHREILSLGYQWLADKLVGTGGLDSESGYKFLRRTIIKSLLSRATAAHWFWDTELIVFARRLHLRILEVPVLFIRRFDKKSSVNLMRDVVDYLVNLWKLRLRLNRGNKRSFSRAL